MNFKVDFASGSDLNFTSVPYYYLSIYQIDLYELSNGTYKRVWSGSLQSFLRNRSISVQLKAGTPYKIVEYLPPISGYNCSYHHTWTESGGGELSGTPKGWNEWKGNTQKLYFTPLGDNTYNLILTNTFKKG